MIRYKIDPGVDTLYLLKELDDYRHPEREDRYLKVLINHSDDLYLCDILEFNKENRLVKILVRMLSGESLVGWNFPENIILHHVVDNPDDVYDGRFNSDRFVSSSIYGR